MTVAIMERQTTMWELVTDDPAARGRFSALYAELAPLYFGTAPSARAR